MGLGRWMEGEVLFQRRALWVSIPRINMLHGAGPSLGSWMFEFVETLFRTEVTSKKD